MLKALSVKNLGVIEDVFIEFDNGLNIITGETGAGKSVLIGAVKLLLGERFNKNLIRDESLPVKIEAVFENNFDFLDDDIKDEFDIESEIIVKRIIDASGKNKISINGNIATLNQLKDIVSELVDIHGQHENQKLLNPKNHLKYIDKFIKSDNLKIYKDKFSEYINLKREYETLKSEISDLLKNKDFLEFQIKEIEELNIKLPDDLELEDKLNYMTNIEKINENISGALNNLKDGEINAYSLISDALKNISYTCRYIEKLKDAESRLNSVLYNLDEIASELYEYMQVDEFDPNILNELNARKYRLDNLKKKYNLELDQILDYKTKLKNQLDSIEINEDEIQKIEKKLNDLKNILLKQGELINKERKNTAKTICEKIERILNELELKNTIFDFNLKILDKIDDNAFAEGEFVISTNAGFEPAGLSKIASGGEISRVMLAIKDVFAESDNVSTLIFDEIDTGISGKTAKKVAEKLKNISNYKQLIVITHLPVVAAMADKHFHISKIQADNTTKTVVNTLDKLAQKEILAAMISGSVTEMSIKQAEELING
ncbi:DNA repair protein RecN [Deferribacteraceae bacterium V6Fe1]|nr:DNA repair protein RecN [Deferribacteraceae bacterium V6Fe1]